MMTSPIAHYDVVTTADEILQARQDLAYYVRLLWRWRWALGGAAMVAALLALLIGLSRERMYEGSLYMGLNRSKLTDEVGESSAGNFRPLVFNQGIAAEVIGHLNLKKGQELMSVQTFMDDVLTVDELRGTSFLVVRARARDRQLAAEIANLTAERAVELVRRLSGDEAVQLRDDLAFQLEESKRRLDTAREALSAFRTEAQLDLLDKDVQALLAEREGLLKLTLDLQAVRSGVAAAERELAGMQATSVLRRTVDSDAGLATAVNETRRDESVLGLQMLYEESNPVHQEVAGMLARQRNELARLETRRKQLIDEQHLGEPGHKKLSELYVKESRLAELDLEVKLAEAVFTEVSTKYEGARLRVAERATLLQIIGRAQAPVAPLPRGAGRSSALAFALTLVAGAAGVIATDALRNALQEQ